MSPLPAFIVNVVVTKTMVPTLKCCCDFKTLEKSLNQKKVDLHFSFYFSSPFPISSLKFIPLSQRISAFYDRWQDGNCQHNRYSRVFLFLSPISLFLFFLYLLDLILLSYFLFSNLFLFLHLCLCLFLTFSLLDLVLFSYFLSSNLLSVL